MTAGFTNGALTSSGEGNFFGQASGFTGSNVYTFQKGLQTTDATPLSLSTDDVTLNASEAAIFWGWVVAAQDDHTQALWGNFTFGARKQAAGSLVIVGSPVINQDTNFSTASFTCDVFGTSSMRVRVTGEGGTTINWVLYAHSQKVLTNA